jgi:hypothetical protein
MPTKKAPPPKPKASTQKLKLKAPATLPPQTVHDLLRVTSPCEPPPQPADWPDRITLWDPGLSILEMRRKFWHLFYFMEWYDGLPFAKNCDVRKWRQFKALPILPGKTYGEQLAKLQKGDEVPFAREVVTFLLVRYLATERFPFYGTLRCRDVLPSKRRVIVSFGPLGFDIGSVDDDRVSPGLGLATVFVPQVKRNR